MKWIQIAISAAATFAICVLIHLVLVHNLEKKHAKAIADQITADVAACDLDKETTKGANDGLQKSCEERIARLKRIRVQPVTCIPVWDAEQAQSSTSGAGSVPAYGLSSEWLREYASENCKRYFDERIILEKFIDDAAKAKSK